MQKCNKCKQFINDDLLYMNIIIPDRNINIHAYHCLDCVRKILSYIGDAK